MSKVEDNENKEAPLIKAEAEENEFLGVPKQVKFQLFLIFFLMGIINHLGNILVLTGGRILAYELKLKDFVTLYTSSSSLFAVLTRTINSRLFIKVSYKKRMVIICGLMLGGYLSMFGVFQLFEGPLKNHNILCFVLTFIPSFCLGSAYAFGEGAVL